MAEAQTRLEIVGLPSAATEATWLVEEAAGFSAAELVLSYADTPTIGGVARFDAMLERRSAQEPIQYVLGHWPFRNLDLLVDRRALIPRPETELLVGYALDALESIKGTPTVVDLGTGTGAIGLAIAAENKSVNVWLTDNDSEALDLARANLAGLGVSGSRVTIAHGTWFEALDVSMHGGVQLVVSNPPYVADDELLPESVAAWEPARALFSGSRGLDAIEVLLSQARGWLARGGTILLEHGYSQGASVLELATLAGYSNVKTHRDNNGLDRILQASVS